ncbi:hypothetical protein PFLUV_G00170400 [Perca fluviatilis]|uniref:Uncharacterized protein n=1 Tax=Perca fluviatilis TaxID=8168 RepID=A0A6A5EJG8_PERFL|nr:hypothetical protein PFLUV_G00170400 [Perca fluviatilis]
MATLSAGACRTFFIWIFSLTAEAVDVFGVNTTAVMLTALNATDSETATDFWQTTNLTVTDSGQTPGHTGRPGLIVVVARVAQVWQENQHHLNLLFLIAVL